MPSIKQILQRLKHGKSKKIKNIAIKRDAEHYIIDGFAYDLEEAANYISEKGSSGRGIDYNKTIFMLARPHGSIVTTRKVNDRSEHQKLITEAKRKGLYVYYSSVVQFGDRYLAGYPKIVDWESVPDSAPPPKSKRSKTQIDIKHELNCPYCSKRLSSTPGRTNHVKAKHPEKLEEYLADTNS